MFILLGLPGTGKSIQSQMLSQLKKIHHIGPGMALRKKAQETNDLELINILKTGSFVSDKLVGQIIKEELDNHLDKTCVIEGYPRTLEQITGLKHLLQDTSGKFLIKKVFVLDCPNDVLINRLNSRKVCNKCHQSFTYLDHQCNQCLIDLTVRSDDNPDAIQLRITQQKAYLDEILQHFTNYNITVETVNGNQSVENVFAQLSTLIDNSH